MPMADLIAIYLVDFHILAFGVFLVTEEASK